jgi:DNA-directed RNA polymerase sigma subunit (sigma70/sigma32)
MYAEVRKNVFENDKIEIEKQYNKRIEDSNAKYDSNIASIDEQMGLITSVEESERSDSEKERLTDLIAEKEQLKEAKAEAENKLKESIKETITKVTDRYNKVLEQVPAYIEAV